MLKYIKFILISVFIIVLSSSLALAAEETFEGYPVVEVEVNGEIIEYDVPPVLIDGRTMVPFRFIGEAFGAKVGWDSNRRAAMIFTDEAYQNPNAYPHAERDHGRYKELPIVQVEVDNEVIEGDVPGVMLEERTLVPFRFIVETLGYEVGWNSQKGRATAALKETTEMKLLYTDDRWDEILNLALSPNGDTVVVNSELYSLERKEVYISKEDEDSIEMISLDFSPDGSTLASAWWGVDLYDSSDLTHIKNISSGSEMRVRFAPSGEFLGITRNDKTWLLEKISDIKFNEVAEFISEDDDSRVSAIEFSPDGKYLVAGHDNGKIYFWDTESRDLAKVIDLKVRGSNHNLTFSPDGKMLVASEPDLSGEFYIYNMEDFSKKNTIDVDGRINRIQFSPDGSKLAYGYHGGGVEILCTDEWSIIYSFEQDSTVRGLAFSPDSETMVVGSGSGTLYVYGYR